MRIGIWCNYGKTLVPSEGIGVFAHNLAANLVVAKDCRVLLVAGPGDSGLMEETVSRGGGKIEIAESPRTSRLKRFFLKQLKRLRWKRFYEGGTIAGWLDRGIALASQETNRRVAEILDRADVWILPHVKFEHPILKPTIVCIHDLIPYHYPEMMKSHKLREFKTIVQSVADQCVIAACMSHFIKENDLVGQLRLPEKKIRVIRAAVPDDIAEVHNSDKECDRARSIDARLDAPYLFYPSAFRRYKNHTLLIRALRLLKDRTDRNWKLAFTGIRGSPDYIDDEIRKHHLQEDVVILRQVSRGELLTLYRNAFATVVPSLYEQGSYPLMEAISQGCPIMSSDIPSLREQFGQIGNDMLFFDPHDPDDVVAQCQRLAEHRLQIIESQKAGFADWKSYRGIDAALEWYRVCTEAVEQHASRNVHPLAA
jgi:glycosyltransferase involved in cell wall biosynthesis